MPTKKSINWTTCSSCQGRGKKRRRIRKKAKIQYQKALEEFEKTKVGNAPTPPKGDLYSCLNCMGSGLLASDSLTPINKKIYPHIAIVGGGIGGTALAVACLHRGIPFTLFEKDKSFDARSQGYGLTLQQASKAMAGLGILNLDGGIISTKHVVHTTDGKEIGEWGTRKSLEQEDQKKSRRTNIHIARQALRLALLEQLGGHQTVNWNHQLINFKENDKGVALEFKVEGELIKTKADLVVGADGIRSLVRSKLIGADKTPLNYLGCIVILGICPLKNLNGLEHPLLDGATVFQTANGHERIYIMPFAKDTIMWQLSFPTSEKEAIALSEKGPDALKEEACHRTQWHTPIPEIMAATNSSLISGYPVYDRALLQEDFLSKAGAATILGDAAHPMSPFKGQGANQALLDALLLARIITQACRPQSNWRAKGIRNAVLNEFEKEMLERTSVKVKDSAAAAYFLHSDLILQEGDSPRGRMLKDK